MGDSGLGDILLIVVKNNYLTSLAVNPLRINRKLGASGRDLYPTPVFQLSSRRAKPYKTMLLTLRWQKPVNASKRAPARLGVSAQAPQMFYLRLSCIT